MWVVALSGLYSDDILDQIARANDIVEVVQSYFPLKRAGKDYTALCPFHAEKTPSFSVSPSKQIFKCFGCGRGGSVFNFVMAKENVPFPEAVRILADRAGIEVRRDPAAEKRAGTRRKSRDVLAWATRYFVAGLKHPKAGTPGRQYLERRGIAPATIETFQVGYAPDGWENLIEAARREEIGPEMLETAGLVVRRDDGSGWYDRFRGRVIFPIFDALNRPIGFGGRALGDDEPKYLNSPETPLFHKSETLYGLPQARAGVEADRRVVVVEGYFDVLMPHQVGVTNVVATLGTALTDGHIRALRRYADEVVIVFDNDLAGQRAADRGMELFLAHDVRILMAVVPDGKDPCDYCTEHGADAFRARISEAQDAFKYKWDLVQRDLEAATNPAAQRRALEAMLTSVLQAPSLAQQDLRLQRDLILGHMSRTLGIPEATLRSEFSRLRRSSRRSAVGTEVGSNLPDPATRGRRWVKERELLTALVCRPSWLDDVVEAVPPDRIEAREFRQLYEALLGSASRRDGDIESIVRGFEDTSVASLAVDLFEAGGAVEACRSEADTGLGPLRAKLDEALEALKEMEAEADLAARRRAARENDTEDGRALRDFAEARVKRQGFLPPSARRRGTTEP
ncbi:MAG TPA: DNA primase [Phycisphaerae bacterium]|nr:DNA primase [Phycisphaerae bacterium]